MLRFSVRIWGLLWLSLWILALYHRHDLAPPQQLQELMSSEPRQTEIRQEPFQTTRNGIEYTIKPLYDYDLYGLVVSKHNADSWLDYVHRQWSDNLNVIDLCVIWGRNAQNGAYTRTDVHFSSAQFTCYWQADNQQALAAFVTRDLSNNHLLTDNPQLAKIMASVEVGDQVHFHGRLSEYSHNHNGIPFQRGTSISRDDSGGHACETVFVDEFEIVRVGNPIWRKLYTVSIIGLVLYVVAWLMLPARRYGR
jgi:hypothetical protein